MADGSPEAEAMDTRTLATAGLFVLVGLVAVLKPRLAFYVRANPPVL